MTAYTTQEKLAAILLLETAKNSDLNETSIKNALTLAMEYANIGVCRTVLSVLEYPDTTRANA